MIDKATNLMPRSGDICFINVPGFRVKGTGHMYHSKVKYAFYVIFLDNIQHVRPELYVSLDNLYVILDIRHALYLRSNIKQI